MPLLAEELKLIPGLSVKEEYNDNIFLAPDERRADFITTLTPSLDISSATERTGANLSTGINWLDYARNGNLDSVDYFAQGGINHRYHPRLTLSAGAGYVRNSRPDRTDTNGLALKSGSGKQNYQVSGTYAVSEKSTASLSYVYTREIFENSTQLSTTVHNVGLSQSYDLDRYLRQAHLLGRFEFTDNLTAVSRVSNYTATLGLDKKVHELWFLSFDLGGRFTHSDFDVISQGVTSTASNSSQGWVGNLSLGYSGETVNGALTFNHDISTAAGRTGATERTGISAQLEKRFSRELSANFGMGYSLNTSDRNRYSSQFIDENNLSFRCGLRYDFSKEVALEGNYRYSTIDDKQSSAQRHQSIVLLGLTMRTDLLDL